MIHRKILAPLLAHLIVPIIPLQADIITSAGTSLSSQTASLGTQAFLGATPSHMPGIMFNPLAPKPAPGKHPWKTGIVATVFWVGEVPTKKNPMSNSASSWDQEWKASFGGFDDPDPRNRATDYRPVSFVPKENPFYVALPYNDCVDHATTKAEARKVIPWFKDVFQKEGRSVCRNRWVAVRHGDRTCYAQWSDCGPFVTNDAGYVFGNARPANAKNNGAGLDLAPAVRDYLDFRSGGKCDWRFVELAEVPGGPWKTHGANNLFAQHGSQAPAGRLSLAANDTPAASQTSRRPSDLATVDSVGARLEELRQQRDLWFKSAQTSSGWSR